MLPQLAEKIGIEFRRPELLELAFVHRSALNEGNFPESNERLEFLGDAVLELVATRFLYDRFPGKPEGELTNLRAALVRGEHLAEVATNLGLGQFLRLSKGEEKSGGRHKAYLLANAVEALIGAIYLDRGLADATRFIDEQILRNTDALIARRAFIDDKSLFQERAQAEVGITPAYRLIGDSGPDHAKTFEMAVYLRDELVATGLGNSKQNAEQAAAKAGLVAKGWM